MMSPFPTTLVNEKTRTRRFFDVERSTFAEFEPNIETKFENERSIIRIYDCNWGGGERGFTTPSRAIRCTDALYTMWVTTTTTTFQRRKYMDPWDLELREMSWRHSSDTTDCSADQVVSLSSTAGPESARSDFVYVPGSPPKNDMTTTTMTRIGSSVTDTRHDCCHRCSPEQSPRRALPLSVPADSGNMTVRVAAQTHTPRTKTISVPRKHNRFFVYEKVFFPPYVV